MLATLIMTNFLSLKFNASDPFNALDLAPSFLFYKQPTVHEDHTESSFIFIQKLSPLASFAKTLVPVVRVHMLGI